MSVDMVPRGRAQRSGERFMRCRNEINAVVFLCLAETDAVSACVQHDMPARWSEQVPESALRVLWKVSVLCWLCGRCGAGRVRLAQETRASPFLAALGSIGRLCLSLGLFFIIEPCFSQEFLKVAETFIPV